VSTHNDIDITCANCGEDFRGAVWTAVHAAQDPELKDLLLGGELNMVMCPSCGNVAYQDHFVLYQDPSAQMVAYVYPLSGRAREGELHRAMMDGFKEAQAVYPENERKSYGPKLFFGLRALVEQLHKEEERREQSDVVREICRQNNWPYTELRPAETRELHALPVIPARSASGGRPSRAEVLKGIERLLKHNPALGFYAELRDAIEGSPGWHL
jgi:hypothetical protein